MVLANNPVTILISTNTRLNRAEGGTKHSAMEDRKEDKHVRRKDRSTMFVIDENVFEEPISRIEYFIYVACSW